MGGVPEPVGIAWLGNLANVGFNYVRALDRSGMRAVLHARKWDLRATSTSNPEHEYTGASREPYVRYHSRDYLNHLLNLLGFVGLPRPWEWSVSRRYSVVQAQTCREITALRLHRNWGTPYAALATGADLSEVAFGTSRFSALYRRSLAAAQHLFLVNINQLEALPRLPVAVRAWSYLPLLVNVDPLAETALPGREPLVLYSSARQDWTTSRPSGKGNDVFFRGYAEYVRRHGHGAFEVQVRDWGVDRAATRQLVAELGVGASVRFVPPQGRAELFNRIAAADVVIDQFRMGAIGLAALEAMAVGRPVIAYCNQDWARCAYGQEIPVINCADAGQVCEQLTQLTAGSAAARGIVARAWVREYHGETRVVGELRRVYAALIRGCRSPRQGEQAGE